MATPILQLESLSKFYTSAQNVVVGLNSVNISFHRGEFVAITGESGSGKSTLAHILSGMLRYESGELYFNGRPTSHYDGGDWERYRRDNISFISQNYGILLSATVMENVVSALRLSGMENKAARAEAKTILEKVELWELRRRRAAKLSSGQKQRLSIARALAKPAPILIADEPTGNLDPENSAKVIRLLSEAAKDRLVLLITHDFSEAEGCATRRISLQDGRITMDAALRSPCEPDKLPAPREKKKKEALSFYVSRLQLGGRPVWGSFVLLFFALTAFAVFAFLGTFIVNLDDAGTRVYDGSAFPNGDQNRIVVQRVDGGPLTDEDFANILSAKYVKSLEKYGFLTDVNYFYIKDTHYRSAYTLVNVGTAVDPVYEQIEETEFLSYGLYARTVPLLAKGEFLTAGREPENINEVVVAGDESRIGQSFRLYLQDTKQWSLSRYIYLDVTVVGVTDYGEGVYLHDDAGRMFTLSTLTHGWLSMPLDTLSGNESIHYKGRIREEWLYTERSYNGLMLYIKDTHLIPCDQLIQVSYKVFDSLIQPGYTTQASVTIENYAYTGRVLQALQDMGYAAISPYQLGATRQVESLMIERLQTLIICAAVLLVVLVLQIIVLRALFGSEIENYRLLANIGLTCATAQRSVYWQILLFTALGQGVGFGALWYCNRIGIERIVSIIRYLPGELMALLSAVHLAAALLAAAVIARAVRKRIYPLLQSTDDIRLDEEVAV